MHTRIFKKIHVLTKVQEFCPRTKTPPVLLIADVHSRPAAIQILCNHLQSLKLRGYNILMREGIGGGKTLSEELQRTKQNEDAINKIFQCNPRFKELMNRRYQITSKEFNETCQGLFAEAPFNFKPAESEELIKCIAQHNLFSVPFYQHLKNAEFFYQNLDEDYYPSIFRPSTSRRDLDFRDEQYAIKISKAYQQGYGVISILGGLHVLSDPTLNLYKKARQLIGDRLYAMDIPFIGLFPFRSDHIPTVNVEMLWQKQMDCPVDTSQSSHIYPIDIAEPSGNKRFLDVVDTLLATSQNQVAYSVHIKK